MGDGFLVQKMALELSQILYQESQGKQKRMAEKPREETVMFKLLM